VIDKKTCSFCSNIVKLNNNTIDVVKDTSKEEVAKYYVSNYQPIIVSDVDEDNIDMTKLSEVNLIMYRMYIIVQNNCVLFG